ncbi:hypothetical protein Tco_0016812 [Tanacetum coccineum]
MYVPSGQGNRQLISRYKQYARVAELSAPRPSRLHLITHHLRHTLGWNACIFIFIILPRHLGDSAVRVNTGGNGAPQLVTPMLILQRYILWGYRTMARCLGSDAVRTLLNAHPRLEELAVSVDPLGWYVVR